MEAEFTSTQWFLLPLVGIFRNIVKIGHFALKLKM